MERTSTITAPDGGRWRHMMFGRCSTCGGDQHAVRYSDNGVAPPLPWEERYPGEFCIQCYMDPLRKRQFPGVELGDE